MAAETFESCVEANNTLIKLLRSLGFRINWKKAVDPMTEQVFLGIRINSVQSRISLDPNKTSETISMLDETLCRTRLSKHQLQSLAGKLSWASNVIPFGRSFICRIFILYI